MEKPAFDLPPEAAAELDVLKAALAEAADVCAELAIEMYLEAQRLSKKLNDAQQ